MASIYQNAILVIAAADSKDSSVGLFEANRPEPLVFNCPINSSNGIMSNCRIAADRGAEWGPMGGPLRERGWAFQEWYLGRRMIFFTSKGLRWKCEESEMGERGGELELGMHEANSWICCLEEYSGKKLTYEKDRMVALLGIVADLKRSRNDSFREDVGVWEDELAEQLLWRQLELPRKRDGPPLPSWSWAATVGKKAWLFYFPHETRLKAALNDTPQTVRLTQSVSVRASGHLVRVTTESSRLEQCCMESLNEAFNLEERAMLPHDQNYPESDDIARHTVLDVDGNFILGLAIFDNGLHFSTCCCFILGSTEAHPDLRQVLLAFPTLTVDFLLRHLSF
ncbi:hypothetical protein BJ166DRAFT_120083 [Pestalotiopsis sp. NC0098]|nr:hypothetical protein BJ166DRAFT_120083 [Pestalotiopsis sp. NC0098]